METIAENSVLLNWNDDDATIISTQGDTTVITSEAFIYYIWHTAVNDCYTDDFSDFKTAWNLSDTVLIPQDNEVVLKVIRYI